MILVIRFIGVLNAAIWLGASVFFLYAARGTFFSETVKATGVHPFWPGVFAQLLIGKLFALHVVCAAVALAHMLAEWVYLGRALQRFMMTLLGLMFLIGLMAQLVLLPRMKEMHLTKYSMSAAYKPVQIPTEARVEAMTAFSRWHGISMAVNMAFVGVLAFYFWRVTHPADNLRFVGGSKFRG